MISATTELQLGENVVVFLMRMGDTELSIQKHIGKMDEITFDGWVKEVTKEIKRQLFPK